MFGPGVFKCGWHKFLDLLENVPQVRSDKLDASLVEGLTIAVLQIPHFLSQVAFRCVELLILVPSGHIRIVNPLPFDINLRGIKSKGDESLEQIVVPSGWWQMDLAMD